MHSTVRHDEIDRMIEDIVNYFVNTGIYKEIIVVIIAALPVIELRGAIPVAINVFHMPWYWAYVLAIAGNMLPVPFLLVFFDFLEKLLNRTKTGKRFMQWVLKRARRPSALLKKYERIGLILFVAIPLPVTGAWTGSVAAFICGIKFKHSLLAILTGVLIAGVIVTCLSLLGWIGALIAGVALCIFAVAGWWKI
jgi:uncharacterized membrane protein